MGWDGWQVCRQVGSGCDAELSSMIYIYIFLPLCVPTERASICTTRRSQIPPQPACLAYSLSQHTIHLSNRCRGHCCCCPCSSEGFNVQTRLRLVWLVLALVLAYPGITLRSLNLACGSVGVISCLFGTRGVSRAKRAEGRLMCAVRCELRRVMGMGREV
ncbi:hypothetical protein IQ07DRAFT_34368 [Pyrenochaeta sp. DS3sAY3a]|nr:hypothetical protein IQ07DRAFT_34368 [Pyrenochaeta sp. DS3sAY3a]